MRPGLGVKQAQLMSRYFVGDVVEHAVDASSASSATSFS